MASQNKGMITSLVIGSAFLILGCLSLMGEGLEGEWMACVASNGDMVLGLALIMVGAIFLAGVNGFRNGLGGEAYLIVGCMMGLFIGLVTLLTLLADASQAYLLASEDFVDWVPMDDFTPAILMMIPCLVVLWYELKAFKIAEPRSWKKEDRT